jgi:hypothetical protein
MARVSRGGRRGTSVLDFEFQLDSLFYVYTFGRTYTHLRLAQNFCLPEIP